MKLAFGTGALLVAASIGLAGPAAAQTYGPPGGMGPGPGPGGYYGRQYGPPSAQSVDQNLADLRSRLAITPTQESAWEGFANAVRQQTRQMQTLSGNLRQPGATAPERLTQVAEVMQQRAAGMSAVAQAMTRLYAVLGEEQRSVVDEEFPAPPARPGAGGGPPIR
jgi:hypothetical protein